MPSCKRLTGAETLPQKAAQGCDTRGLCQAFQYPIKRISKFSAFKADEQIKQTEAEIDEVNNHLNNIIPYSINYFRQIKKKYGASRTRRTEIRNFDTIEATQVVMANEKLYVNRAEGFVAQD